MSSRDWVNLKSGEVLAGLKHHDWINPDTGRKAAGLLVIQGRKYPKGVEFVTMFRSGWEWLSTQRLSALETAVMCAMIARISFDNFIGVSQRTLAEETKIAQPNLNKALKKLIEKGIIETEADKNDKRRRAYRLNPALGWMGDAAAWGREMQVRTGTNVIPMPGCLAAGDRSLPAGTTTDPTVAELDAGQPTG